MAQFVQKTIRKSGREYYETHLHLINPLLEHSLTPTEIVVLSAFMSDVSEIATIDRFHREVRKKVKRDLEISNGGLSNYLRAFKDKEIVEMKMTLHGSQAAVKKVESKLGAKAMLEIYSGDVFEEYKHNLGG